MSKFYKLHVTDDNVVHECVSTPPRLCDMTVCGVATQFLYRRFGPRSADDNFRVVKDKPVSCVGCLGVTEDEKLAMWDRYSLG